MKGGEYYANNTEKEAQWTSYVHYRKGTYVRFIRAELN